MLAVSGMCGKQVHSDRVLDPHVGCVAYDGSVLHVLAVLRRDVLVGAVPDGLLLAQTLHLIHVDGAHAYSTNTTSTSVCTQA